MVFLGDTVHSADSNGGPDFREAVMSFLIRSHILHLLSHVLRSISERTIEEHTG